MMIRVTASFVQSFTLLNSSVKDKRSWERLWRSYNASEFNSLQKLARAHQYLYPIDVINDIVTKITNGIQAIFRLKPRYHMNNADACLYGTSKESEILDIFQASLQSGGKVQNRNTVNCSMHISSKLHEKPYILSGRVDGILYIEQNKYVVEAKARLKPYKKNTIHKNDLLQILAYSIIYKMPDIKFVEFYEQKDQKFLSIKHIHFTEEDIAAFQACIDQCVEALDDLYTSKNNFRKLEFLIKYLQ